jgi:excisionase family DNA binding protein
MRELEKDEIRQILERPAITPADALKVLPISRNGLYEAIRRGEIKSVKLGKKILVPTGPLRRQLGIEA